MTGIQIALVVILIVAVIGFGVLYWWTNRNHAVVVQAPNGVPLSIAAMSPATRAALLANAGPRLGLLSNPNPSVT